MKPRALRGPAARSLVRRRSGTKRRDEGGVDDFLVVEDAQHRVAGADVLAAQIAPEAAAQPGARGASVGDPALDDLLEGLASDLVVLGRDKRRRGEVLLYGANGCFGKYEKGTKAAPETKYSKPTKAMCGKMLTLTGEMSGMS